MVIITGGAGFIGSILLKKLNEIGIKDIIIVEDFRNNKKWKNILSAKFLDIVHYKNFPKIKADVIFHLGAITSTTESDFELLFKQNYEFSKEIFLLALNTGARFIYASSAATYGDGTQGFSDDERKLEELKPLNPYGISKHLFDLWLLRHGFLDKVVGLKFFNVFGPNEYHKGEMASKVFKSYLEIKKEGKIKLFKSYREGYKDGEQMRDFIYVFDVVDVLIFFMENFIPGIYNVGSGVAITWNELAHSIFKALECKPQIEYIDMPENIKNQYQYYTKAEIQKLKKIYKKDFTPLEDAIKDYIKILQSSDPLVLIP